MSAAVVTAAREELELIVASLVVAADGAVSLITICAVEGVALPAGSIDVAEAAVIAGERARAMLENFHLIHPATDRAEHEGAAGAVALTCAAAPALGAA